jgi:hypothetical protein
MPLSDAGLLFELDPVTVALRAWLATAVLTGADDELPFPVGDSQAPLDADQRPIDPPYGVLYQLPGERVYAPYAGALEVAAKFQVTSVGAFPSQARYWADRVRSAIAGETDAGEFALAMDLGVDHVDVVSRSCYDDGFIDGAGGLWSWAETYELNLSSS